MSLYITKKEYKNLLKIPRDRFSTRVKIFCGVIVENGGKVMMTLEKSSKNQNYDLPGGKLLWSEDIRKCAERELYEETGYKVTLKNILGVYQRAETEDESDYLRIIFIGELKSKLHKKPIDEKVIKVRWVSKEDILKKKINVRSDEIYRELGEYFSGKSVNLDFISPYIW